MIAFIVGACFGAAFVWVGIQICRVATADFVGMMLLTMGLAAMVIGLAMPFVFMYEASHEQSCARVGGVFIHDTCVQRISP